MKIHYAIVSNNRPDNVPKMEALMEQVDKIYWYVGKNQIKKYQASATKKSIFKESGGLVQSRNAALKEAFACDNYCMMLDDDLKKCEMVSTSMKKSEITFSEMAIEIYNVLSASPLKLAGISPTNNLFYYNPKKPLGLKHFIIASCMMVKPCKLYFDKRFRTKEDYDYTLQHIKQFGGVLRLNYLMPVFQHYTNKGGVVDYRTPELEKDSIIKLKKKWGTTIVRDNKLRPNEILINIK